MPATDPQGPEYAPCGSCAWCTGDGAGSCPHGFSCCANCASCTPLDLAERAPNGFEAALAVLAAKLSIGPATAGLVVGALRSLPVEQRMEAMGMEKVASAADLDDLFARGGWLFTEADRG